MLLSYRNPFIKHSTCIVSILSGVFVSGQRDPKNENLSVLTKFIDSNSKDTDCHLIKVPFVEVIGNFDKKCKSEIRKYV